MVRILGVYQTDHARNWSREGLHLVAPMTEAIQGAIQDAGLEAKDIQVGHVGNFAGGLYTKQGHLGAFVLEADPDLYGIPTSRHEAACASGSVALLSALNDLEARNYDVSLVVGIEQMKTVAPEEGGDYLGTAAWYEREAEGVEFPFPKLFGRLGEERIERNEISNEQYAVWQAYLSNLMFSNARNNPLAQTRDWAMSEEHARTESDLNPRISPTILTTDCSQVTDGASALILVSEDFARYYAGRHGISFDDIPAILGWGHKTAPIVWDIKRDEGRKTPHILPYTRQAIEDAYQRAGINGPDDLDVVEYHDCFTTTLYEAPGLLGLTDPDESFKAIENGSIERIGQYPINPSGGLIGSGHPVGATGVRQAADIYKQIKERAEGYQVDTPNKRGLMVNFGGTATTTVSLLIGKPNR